MTVLVKQDDGGAFSAGQPGPNGLLETGHRLPKAIRVLKKDVRKQQGRIKRIRKLSKKTEKTRQGPPEKIRQNKRKTKGRRPASKRRESLQEKI